MENEFPRMLYKAGGPVHTNDGAFSTLIAADQAEQDSALADGWSVTMPEALAIKATSEQSAADALDAEVSKAVSDDTKPPTREELEQMATKLGLPFSARVSDKKLAALIKAATEQAEG